MARKKKSGNKQACAGQPPSAQKPIAKAAIQQPVSKKPPVGTSAVLKSIPKEPTPPAKSSKHCAPSGSVSKKPPPKKPASKKAAPKIAVSKQSLQPPPSQSSSNRTSASKADFFKPLKYLTEEELLEIDKQFAANLKDVEVLLFWTGVRLQHVQKWAKIWNLTTLTFAMGPLMDPQNLQSPKNQKHPRKYTKYMKGASGRFAQYACQNCRVIVLTNPPPNIYSSRENNTYQHLEEPILKGLLGTSPVRRIDYLHPTVDEAKHITYQTWPCDKSLQWTQHFARNRINEWEQLNWDYQSLLNLSQIGANPAERTKLVTAPQISEAPHQSQKSEPCNRSSASTDLPELTGDDRKEAPVEAEHTGCAVTEENETKIMGEGCPAADPDIECHESRFLATEPGDDQLAGDCSRSEIQPHSQVENKIDFHEDGALLDAPHPPKVEYLVKKCREPISPLTVPVINIDDITAGSEVTVDVDEYSTDHPFLYLKLNCMPRSAIWWKLMWYGSREKNEQPAAMTHL